MTATIPVIYRLSLKIENQSYRRAVALCSRTLGKESPNVDDPERM